jgi:hypothetical protein
VTAPAGRPRDLVSGLLAVSIVLLLFVSALALAGEATPSQYRAPAQRGPGPAAAPAMASGANKAAPFPTPIQHVVVVLMENQNYSTVLAQGPFEAYLAHTYAVATNDYSVHHYSIPAYLAATSGIDPGGFSVYSAVNLGDLAGGADRTWAAFEQSMPQVCDRTTNWTDGYDADHNPFVMFKDIGGNTSRCDAHDLTWSSWTSDVASNSIPNYSFITPNTTDDDHNSSIPVGDAWLKSWLSPLVNDSAIFSNTAFLLSYDESAADTSPSVNGSSGGHVYTVLVSPYSRSLSSDVFYNTFSLLTTAEWLLGLPGGTLRNDSWTSHPPLENLFAFPNPLYSVEFTEGGLPVGNSWSVNFGGQYQQSTTSGITFFEPNGTQPYTVGVVTGYVSNPTGGSVMVQGSTSAQSVTFARVFAATFEESGLPRGTLWNVTVGSVTLNSSTPTIEFLETNGTYGFVLGIVPGWTTTATGSFTISGATATISRTFTVVRYTVTFVETGLPSDINWSVTVGVSTVASNLTFINFHLTNGTYTYSVGNVANFSRDPTGSFALAGNGARIVEKFAVVRYVVTIKESGLPSGTEWNATVEGVTISTTQSFINFHLVNGTYTYSVGVVANYSTPPSGNFAVNGSGFMLVMKFFHVLPRGSGDAQNLPIDVTTWAEPRSVRLSLES